jgi:hypothetical protein
MSKNKTIWQRVKRQIRILIMWLRDLLVLEQAPYDDEPPAGTA